MNILKQPFRLGLTDDQLAEKVEKELGPETRIKKIKKENFVEDLSITQRRLDGVLQSISRFEEPERQAIADRIFEFSNQNGNHACEIYVSLAKDVQRDDLRFAFNSILTTGAAFSTILNEIAASTNEIFSENTMTIHNTKISHLTVFGIVAEANIFTDYAVYLFDCCSAEIVTHRNVPELGRVKPYKLKYLDEHYDHMVYMLKNYINPRIYLDDIKHLRKSQYDIQLVNNNQRFNGGFLNSGKMGTSRNFISSMAFNPFYWLGEQYNLYKQARFMKQSKEKEYLESHVALLRMELAGVDPNTDEYRKRTKTIQAYDNMIAQLDQKMAEYMDDNGGGTQ